MNISFDVIINHRCNVPQRLACQPASLTHYSSCASSVNTVYSKYEPNQDVQNSSLQVKYDPSNITLQVLSLHQGQQLQLIYVACSSH